MSPSILDRTLHIPIISKDGLIDYTVSAPSSLRSSTHTVSVPSHSAVIIPTNPHKPPKKGLITTEKTPVPQPLKSKLVKRH